MEETKIKHLEFIQGAISRLNSNSFQIKGWAITVLTVMMALFAGSNNIELALIAIFPTILFLGADSYCLMQERKMRGIYNDVAEITPIQNRKEVLPFEISPRKYKGGNYCFLRNLLSPTILLFYGCLLTIQIVLTCIILHLDNLKNLLK